MENLKLKIVQFFFRGNLFCFCFLRNNFRVVRLTAAELGAQYTKYWLFLKIVVVLQKLLDSNIKSRKKFQQQKRDEINLIS